MSLRRSFAGRRSRRADSACWLLLLLLLLLLLRDAQIFANEASGLGPAKANKLFEAVNANSELLAVADDPTGYNYSHQHRVMRRHLVHKVSTRRCRCSCHGGTMQ